MKNVLVINAGSSSLKYQLIDMDDEKVIAKGLCERIGIEGSALTHRPTGKEKYSIEIPMPTHGEAMDAVLSALTDPQHGVIKSMDEIKAVGHRVLHGGEKCTESQLVTPMVIDVIRECIPMGPLHNPANLKGIETCMAKMPGIPNVAVFDTAFHQTMPDYAYLYAIPYDAYEKSHIRKYGFHGTSHRYVSARAAEILGSDSPDLKIITCHLGNGSSIAAVKGGKCMDTTMGLSPLEGLAMGTRSGDIDPSAIPYLEKQYGIESTEDAVTFLNKKCGMLGLSGISSDFRDLESAAKEGEAGAIRALNLFNYRVKKYIGAYAAALGGVDAITFAGGVGENDTMVREKVLEGLEFLGIKLDKEKNAEIHGKEAFVNAEDSKVKIIIVPTDEELVIARDTAEIAL